MARKPRPQNNPQPNAIVSSGDDAAGVSSGQRTMDPVTGEIAMDAATPGLVQGAVRHDAVDPVSFDAGPQAEHSLDEVTFTLDGKGTDLGGVVQTNDAESVHLYMNDEPHPPMDGVIRDTDVIDGGLNNVAAGDVNGDGLMTDGKSFPVKGDLDPGDSFEEVSIGVADAGTDDFLKIEGVADEVLAQVNGDGTADLAANQAEVVAEAAGDPGGVADVPDLSDELIIVVCNDDPTKDDITAEDDWEDDPSA
ncbi:MAG: hypothetical protein HYU28_07280 [Actinobacteria bacterium]|nr:hypothetical protein [Actinomycetota bacterium]